MKSKKLKSAVHRMLIQHTKADGSVRFTSNEVRAKVISDSERAAVRDAVRNAMRAMQTEDDRDHYVEPVPELLNEIRTIDRINDDKYETIGFLHHALIDLVCGKRRHLLVNVWEDPEEAGEVVAVDEDAYVWAHQLAERAGPIETVCVFEEDFA